MAVVIETSLYSGPAEILLKLVTDEEIDIWELSLSELIEGYLTEMENHPAVNLDEATEILMIAAVLLQLKSRSLLPRDEEDEIEDLPDGTFDLLIARMLECKTFKAVVSVFEEMASQAARSAPRRYGLDGRFLELMPNLLANVTPNDLRDAYIRSTTPQKPLELSIHHLSPITRTVPETIDKVLQVLLEKQKMTFKSLTADEDRIGIVFYFLAVLELFKMGKVEILQAHAFGEIELELIES